MKYDTSYIWTEDSDWNLKPWQLPTKIGKPPDDVEVSIDKAIREALVRKSMQAIEEQLAKSMAQRTYPTFANPAIDKNGNVRVACKVLDIIERVGRFPETFLLIEDHDHKKKVILFGLLPRADELKVGTCFVLLEYQDHATALQGWVVEKIL